MTVELALRALAGTVVLSCRRWPNGIRHTGFGSPALLGSISYNPLSPIGASP